MGKNKSAYYANIAAQQKAARQFVETSLRAFYKLNPNTNSQEFKDYATQILSQAFRDYGDQAAVVACQEYDSTMKELGFNVAPADISNDFVSKASVENSVRYFNNQLNNGNLDFDGFVKAMVSKANDHALRAANKTIVANAERLRDRKAGVRYARVPTGKETCGFCLMLASRGFVYATKATAGDIGRLYNYYHDFCDCTVIAGTYGTVIDGYDPNWYYEVYRDARKTAGVRNSTLELNKVVNEINRRKREWAWFGEEPKVGFEKGAKPTNNEIECAQALSTHGFEVLIKKESKAYKTRTPDTRINGLYWEFKCPTGDNEKTVKNQFKSASPHNGMNLQCSRLVISALATERSFAQIVEDAALIMGSKEFPLIKEVLIVGENEIRRIKR